MDFEQRKQLWDEAFRCLAGIMCSIAEDQHRAQHLCELLEDLMRELRADERKNGRAN